MGEVVRRSESSLQHKLSAETSVLGLKFYALVGACIGCLIVVVLLILLCLRWKRNSRTRRIMRVDNNSSSSPSDPIPVPVTLKEIIEISKGLNTSVDVDEERNEKKENVQKEEEVKVKVKVGFFNCSDAAKLLDVGTGSSESNLSSSSPSSLSTVSVDVPNMGWGRWYTLRELDIATGGFSDGNVIGEGGYGVVYRGVFPDCSVVAVKNLLNKKGQAEKEFKVEVEAIGKVRHKNLVGLIGYCAEGVQRMLVYEYVGNGNLEQWLHGDVGPVSPLTWDIRMKIAIGTAKGLAYLHEGLEPKVVHRDIKSSNILLDKKWNAKVSDFGLAKLLESDANYVTTRVMGTFGCVAPEYANTGMLSEGSDVYSFGVLLMELISGRSPVDYARHTREVNLVDWFKGMVANRRGEEVVDPLIKAQPSPRALKRMLLVCLRCVDLNAHKRPKMGQVVHMLEADEFPFRADNRSTMSPTVIKGSPLQPKTTEGK